MNYGLKKYGLFLLCTMIDVCKTLQDYCKTKQNLAIQKPGAQQHLLEKLRLIARYKHNRLN